MGGARGSPSQLQVLLAQRSIARAANVAAQPEPSRDPFDASVREPPRDEPTWQGATAAEPQMQPGVQEHGPRKAATEDSAEL